MVQQAPTILHQSCGVHLLITVLVAPLILGKVILCPLHKPYDPNYDITGKAVIQL